MPREEYEQVLQADRVRDEVIQVDAFPAAEYSTLVRWAGDVAGARPPVRRGA